VIALVWICSLIAAPIIARTNYREPVLAFFAAVIFGPLAVIGYALAGRTGIQCAACGELVRREALICRYCGAAISRPTLQARTPTEIAADRRVLLRVSVCVAVVVGLAVAIKQGAIYAQRLADAHGYRLLGPADWFADRQTPVNICDINRVRATCKWLRKDQGPAAVDQCVVDYMPHQCAPARAEMQADQ
jgi:hypothetical protein